ncbi:MAG: HdeD family acid-resistance protein [Burkholderiaceae bacterium]|nr:HdeD family acid-resistance protein [Burkholderiaceae bacterium]
MARSDTATFDTGSPARGRGWQLFWGVLLIVAGVLALLMPAVAALATALVFGWLLLFSGVFEIVYTFQTRHLDGFGWRLASGILTLVLGVAIVFLPVAGIASLALLVGAFLFAAGIARTGLALRLRPRKGWGWVLFDGLLSIAVAILVAIGWPASSIGLVGFLTGFTLVFNGLWRLFAWR